MRAVETETGSRVFADFRASSEARAAGLRGFSGGSRPREAARGARENRREPTNELRQTRFRVSSREARQSAAAGHHRTHTITEKCNVGDHRPLVDCGSRQITRRSAKLEARQLRGPTVGPPPQPRPTSLSLGAKRGAQGHTHTCSLQVGN